MDFWAVFPGVKKLYAKQRKNIRLHNAKKGKNWSQPKAISRVAYAFKSGPATWPAVHS